MNKSSLCTTAGPDSPKPLCVNCPSGLITTSHFYIIKTIYTTHVPHYTMSRCIVFGVCFQLLRATKPCSHDDICIRAQQNTCLLLTFVFYQWYVAGLFRSDVWPAAVWKKAGLVPP